MAYTNKNLLLDRIKNSYLDYQCSLRGIYPLLEGSYADIAYIGEPDGDRLRFKSEI
jgi:hypothetical protein